MTYTHFQHQCTANFKIHNYSRANPALKEALKDLPRLAALASHETGWKIEGTVNVRVMTNAQMHAPSRKDSAIFFSKLNTSTQKHENSSKLLNRILYGKPMHIKYGQAISQNEILINSEHTYLRDPEKGLKATLLHEFVHIAQLQNTPIKTKLDEALKSNLTLKAAEGIKSDAYKATSSAVGGIKYAQEGQATYIQNKALEEGKIESSEAFINSHTASDKHTSLKSKIRSYASYYNSSQYNPYTLGEQEIKKTLEKHSEHPPTEVIKKLFDAYSNDIIRSEINKSKELPDKRNLLIHLSNHITLITSFCKSVHLGRQLIKNQQTKG
ncbi:MAG: hypothetical protein CMD81_11515 [Gammaproteobacteria bacterium]|nr:hypothetical protein [Gammaproteobacteria bacterium]|tara:strand:+ start:3495 stop:4472 length:978 start_codon:yes stop_codon:yes gene_type:complete